MPLDDHQVSTLSHTRYPAVDNAEEHHRQCVPPWHCGGIGMCVMTVARKMPPPRGRFARNLVRQVVLETFCSVSLCACECIATRWCPLHTAEHPPHPSVARTLGHPLLGDTPLRGISDVLRARPSRTDEIKTSSTLPPKGLTRAAVLPESYLPARGVF